MKDFGLVNQTARQEFQRFIVVGIVSTIVNYGFFYTIFGLSGRYILASSAGYIAGLIVGYALNRNWTFGDKKADQKNKEFLLYCIIYAGSLVFSLLFLRALVEWAHFDPIIAQVFAIGLSTLMNFIGLRFIVFRNQDAGHHRV